MLSRSWTNGHENISVEIELREPLPLPEVIRGQFRDHVINLRRSLGAAAFPAASAKSQSSHTVCKVGLGYIELELSCLLILRDIGEHFLAD